MERQESYALPSEVLTPLLAPGLKLDTYGDFGFLAMALVETRSLRPAFLPSQMGFNFFLAGYRFFTRYQTLTGRNLRGLRILRSDTFRSAGAVLANAFYLENVPYAWKPGSREALT